MKKLIIVLVVLNLAGLALMGITALRQADNELRIRVLTRQVQALEARLTENK